MTKAIAIGTPAATHIAMLGAIALFPTMDLAINSLSIMAFILVLGILVDDAIVIGESVYTHEQKHGDQVRAAVEGTHEVYVPVLFGVMTTVAAFLPLTLVEARMGQFFGVLQKKSRIFQSGCGVIHGQPAKRSSPAPLLVVFDFKLGVDGVIVGSCFRPAFTVGAIG